MAGSMRGSIVVPWIFAALVSAACDRQDSAWRDARREVEARAELEARREAEAWERAERLGTPEAWQHYLAGWPEGRFAEEARRLLVAFIPPPRPAPLTAPEPLVDFEIQLGAWSDEALARAGFDRFIGAHTDVFAGAGLRLAGPGEAGDALWRLRAGPFDETTARARCAGLVAAGVSCVPVAGARRDPGYSPPFQ
jgi:hypothetical protein